MKQRPRTDEEELEDYQGAFLNRSGTVLPKYVAMMRMVNRSQSWCRSVGRPRCSASKVHCIRPAVALLANSSQSTTTSSSA